MNLATSLWKIPARTKSVGSWRKALEYSARALWKSMQKAVHSSRSDQEMNSVGGNQKTIYAKARDKYRLTIRKAQRDSWVSFCNEVETTPEATRLDRILPQNPKVPLSRLSSQTENTLSRLNEPWCICLRCISLASRKSENCQALVPSGQGNRRTALSGRTETGGPYVPSVRTYHQDRTEYTGSCCKRQRTKSWDLFAESLKPA